MKIATIGEVMIEVISEMPQPNETKVYEASAIEYGGPVINTAWYSKRLGFNITPLAFLSQRDNDHLKELLDRENIDSSGLLVYNGLTDMIVSMTTEESHFSQYYRSTFPKDLLKTLEQKITPYDVVIMNGSRHSELMEVYERVVIDTKILTVFNPGYSLYEIKNYDLLKLLILNSNIVTLNEQEANYVKGILGLDFENDSFHFQNLVILTKSHKGSIVISKNQRHLVGSMTKLEKDVIGTGDAYISAFLCKYLNTGDIFTSMEFATACAAFVVEEGNIRSHISINDVTQRLNK